MLFDFEQMNNDRNKINYVIESGISDDMPLLLLALLAMINEESDGGIGTCSFAEVGVDGVTAEDDGAVPAVVVLGLINKRKTN